MVAAITPFWIHDRVSSSVSIADDHFVLDAMLAQHGGDFLARQRFQAHESVGVLLLVVAQDLGRGVERDARIAFHIHDTGDLYLRSGLERVAIAPQTLLQIGLLRVW